MFPAPDRDGDNRVVWQRAEFQLLAALTFRVPYFDGHPARQPAVLLRRRSTGQTAWFLSIHNPADTARYHHQGRYRRRAVIRERHLVHRLADRGDPVFLMGDFNAGSQAICPLMNGGMMAAAGGRDSRPCRRPGASRIDWIFATRDIDLYGYRTDTGPVRRHVSDHALRIADATW